MTDILQEFSKRLSSAGLVVDQIEADDILHRCPIEGKSPYIRDGAYIAHLNPPPSIWWQNWHTGAIASWSAKTKDEMTVAEREALKNVSSRKKSNENGNRPNATLEP